MVSILVRGKVWNGQNDVEGVVDWAWEGVGMAAASAFISSWTRQPIRAQLNSALNYVGVELRRPIPQLSTSITWCKGANTHLKETAGGAPAPFGSSSHHFVTAGAKIARV